MRSVRLKKYMATLLAQLLILSFFTSYIMVPEAKAANLEGMTLNVKSAILIEAETGQVLYEFNADDARPPASMSKMMTEYLVMDKLKKGEIKWEDMVTASKYAANVGGSGGLIAENEKLSVKDMFYAMSIYSGNDASVALAEHIGTTEENFAHMMNAKASELGMSEDAHFINATGLSRSDIGQNAPASIQGETIMSARDAAILARALINEFPEVLEFTKIPAKKLRERDNSSMINHNWMLEGNKDTPSFRSFWYEGLDGLKTGFTDEAMYCFTGTAERNGVRLISVVMGTESKEARFHETRKLLDYGFNNFEKKTIIHQKSEVEALKEVSIKKGVKYEVPIVTEKAITFIVPKNVDVDQFQISAEEVDEDQRIAPIEQGQVLGKVTVTYQIPNTESVLSEQVNLIALEEVEKAGWMRLFSRAVKNFFSELFEGIKNIF